LRRYAEPSFLHPKYLIPNQHQFGGDPDHVVIGGDSAGGASVTLLMAAYGGRNDGLFHAAAAESQSFAAVLNVTESQFMYDALVTRSRCNNNPSFTSTLACLRSLPAAQMQRYNIGIPFPGAPEKPLFPYNPTLDYDLIPDLTISLFRSGRYIRVPSIFGDVTNEGTIFTPKSASNPSDVARFLKSQFPAITTNQTDTLNDMYPDTGPRFPFSGSYWRPLSDSYGELRYICPGLFLSRTLAADNVTALSNWNYRYDVQDPRQEARGFGVPHVGDVYAIWGPQNTHGGAPPSLTGRNANIIPVIQGYWTSFIRSFDPNTYRFPGSPRWELFTEQEQGRILFQTNETRMESVPQAQRDRCAYMDSIALSIQQ
jgi:carboxylesterase type B